MKINGYLEHTDLSPLITGSDVDKLVAEAKEFGFLGICVPPFWVKRACREINGYGLRLITPVGFPFGNQMTETKMEELNLAIRDGANEVDVVMNFSAFNIKMPWTKIELAKISKVAHENGCLLKVIIEPGFWDDEQKKNAARLVADIGADFLKTSTGYFDHCPVDGSEIEFFRKVLPENVGIKASGGIVSKKKVVELIKAGADRIGTSAAMKIIKEE